MNECQTRSNNCRLVKLNQSLFRPQLQRRPTNDVNCCWSCSGYKVQFYEVLKVWGMTTNWTRNNQLGDLPLNMCLEAVEWHCFAIEQFIKSILTLRSVRLATLQSHNDYFSVLFFLGSLDKVPAWFNLVWSREKNRRGTTSHAFTHSHLLLKIRRRRKCDFFRRRDFSPRFTTTTNESSRERDLQSVSQLKRCLIEIGSRSRLHNGKIPVFFFFFFTFFRGKKLNLVRLGSGKFSTT